MSGSTDHELRLLFIESDDIALVRVRCSCGWEARAHSSLEAATEEGAAHLRASAAGDATGGGGRAGNSLPADAEAVKSVREAVQFLVAARDAFGRWRRCDGKIPSGKHEPLNLVANRMTDELGDLVNRCRMLEARVAFGAQPPEVAPPTAVEPPLVSAERCLLVVAEKAAGSDPSWSLATILAAEVRSVAERLEVFKASVPSAA